MHPQALHAASAGIARQTDSAAGWQVYVSRAAYLPFGIDGGEMCHHEVGILLRHLFQHETEVVCVETVVGVQYLHILARGHR